ncbi:MAG: PilZ domain-containing protein [Desulfobulbaceae bacterium]|nr:PilZ domain-containing protein [Desulfobulbaceae bacterium]
MEKEISFKERRKHKRFIMRDGTYAFLRPPANKLGQIIDISMSGLAFSYFSTNGASLESAGLDVLADEGVFLENLPIKTVNDFVLPNEQPFSQITMRRRCVKFKSLSREHKEHLLRVIEKYGRSDI